MKRMIATLASTVLASVALMGAQAQEKEPSKGGHLTSYGFVRTYAVFDTRDSKAGTADLTYLLPYDKTTNREGKDIYSNPSFKIHALSSRLGVNFSGYEYGRTKVSGKVEADFYLMNGTSASVRLRQAYADVVWDSLGYMENVLSFRIGQAWHPLAEDLPCCINQETGTPFNPFNRSPLVMFTANMSNWWYFKLGAIYPVQYLPTGPQGPSENYVKYSPYPEVYLGMEYSRKGFTAKIGADMLSIKPRWKSLTTDNKTYDVGTKVNDRLCLASPFMFLQYRHGRFCINAKSVFANSGEHLSLMGGYALYDDSDPFNFRYTPIRSTVSFLSFSYGRKFQFMCMGGYMKNLGTWNDLKTNYFGFSDPNSIYYYASGFKNINQMVRATPTLAFNVGGMTIAAEYNLTMVEYGDVNQLNRRAIPYAGDLHWILNNRTVLMFKFNF